MSTVGHSHWRLLTRSDKSYNLWLGVRCRKRIAATWNCQKKRRERYPARSPPWSGTERTCCHWNGNRKLESRKRKATTLDLDYRLRESKRQPSSRLMIDDHCIWNLNGHQREAKRTRVEATWRTPSTSNYMFWQFPNNTSSWVTHYDWVYLYINYVSFGI